MAEQEQTVTTSQTGGWRKIFTDLLPIDYRTTLGTVVVFVTLLLIGWVAINEQTRMATFTRQYEARSIQRGAVIFAGNCSRCHGVDGRGIEGIAPALNAPDLFDGSRLEKLAYPGSLKSYVELTIAAGRPARSGEWPSPMPTWSQTFGGPMRPDEVRDVAAYVLNWGCQYDPECISDEEADALEAGAAVLPTPLPAGGEEATPVPLDLDAIVAELPEGDAARGAELFTTLSPPCSACHSVDGSPLVGPSLLGVKDRAPEGYASVEHYLVESIWRPNNFVVEGFATPSAMPGSFEQRMTLQDLADIIAYLLSLE